MRIARELLTSHMRSVVCNVHVHSGLQYASRIETGTTSVRRWKLG